MQLYAGMSEYFISDTVHNRIAEKLKDSFFRHYRFQPAPSELRSWQNSLRAVAQAFQHADLDDHGIILEYQLPLSSRRLDCLVCGKDANRSDQAVVIELKQWDHCTTSPANDVVCTMLGGFERETLHPSVQVRQYRYYLQHTHTAFYEQEPVGLASVRLCRSGLATASLRFAKLSVDRSASRSA